MALIQCPEPECRQMVSSSAEHCPKCGVPIASGRKSSGSINFDPRVKQSLDSIGYKSYEILADGDFKITLTIDNGSRSQVAFINSNTNTICGLELRDIYSCAYKIAGPIDATISNKLLLENRKLTLGSWSITEPLKDGRSAIIFTVPMLANCAPEQFDKALGVVLRTADDFEKEHYGTDEW